LAVPLPGSAVERECEGDLCIELERTEGGAVFFAINRQAAPASMVLEFPVLENMRVSVPLPLRTVVPPHSRERLLAIRSEDPSQSYRWRWSWSWTTGVLNASHDDDSRYLLPWSASHRFAVLQAAGGTLSHFGKARFAFDFRMPSDTLVVAARGGTVVRAIDHFRKGGLEERLKKRANAVFVLHEDGTIARYLHLRPGGALVEPGESLRAGEPIGRSGNTGYSQSPHLHFDVFAVDDELGWQTVPVRFADGTAQGLVPTPGALLYGGAR
jgi:murein DD-endopeptidase MepM/ murein hydrolase activator NlpD